MHSHFMFSISKVLICRNYMGSVDMNEIDNFMPIMMKREEDADLSPVVIHGSTHFLWIKHSNLYCILFFKCKSIIFIYFTVTALQMSSVFNT